MSGYRNLVVHDGSGEIGLKIWGAIGESFPYTEIGAILGCKDLKVSNWENGTIYSSNFVCKVLQTSLQSPHSLQLNSRLSCCRLTIKRPRNWKLSSTAIRSSETSCPNCPRTWVNSKVCRFYSNKITFPQDLLLSPSPRQWIERCAQRATCTSSLRASSTLSHRHPAASFTHVAATVDQRLTDTHAKRIHAWTKFMWCAMANVWM